MIGKDRAKPFKTSESKREEIADPVLQMAHIFLASNLLGHENTTITTTELYFLWCMVKKIKVHIGYWLAHSCHKITHHPARRLYACHLVGAYLLRNVRPEILIPRSSMPLCEEPEWFGKDFLISIGLVKKTEEGLVLCGLAQAKEKDEGKTDENGSETKKAAEMETFQGEPSPTPEKSGIPEPLPESGEQNPGVWKRNGRGLLN